MKKSKPPYKHVWSDGDTGHYYLVPLDASESLWQIHRKNRGRIALISEPGTLAQTTEIVQLLLNPNSAPYPAPVADTVIVEISGPWSDHLPQLTTLGYVSDPDHGLHARIARDQIETHRQLAVSLGLRLTVKE